MRPKILTAAWWTRRLDAVTDGVPRMVRTGTQAVLLVLGQDVAGIDWFALDWWRVGQAFLGGCAAWFVLTVVMPPADASAGRRIHQLEDALQAHGILPPPPGTP